MDERNEPQQQGGSPRGGSGDFACSSPDELAHNIKPGALIDGLFVVKGFLGEGAMGEIYLVEQTSTGRSCALKMLPGRVIQANARTRFVREANLLARLDHPGITTVFNAGLHEGRDPYYVMELIEGKTLSDLLKERGALDEKDAIEIFLDLSDALAYAHGKGVVHRDIKPSNIMVKFDETYQSKSAKLLDFGIAKLVGTDGDPTQGLTATGQVVGSPLYMSPEQGLGQRLDNRSDIYSLGCSFFEALSGKPPFYGASALETIGMHQSQLPPKLSKVVQGKVFDSELEEFVAISMRKNPAERFQTAGEFHTELLSVKQKLAKRPLVRTAVRLAALAAQATVPEPVKNEEMESTEELALRQSKASTKSQRIILPVVAVLCFVVAAAVLFFTFKGNDLPTNLGSTPGSTPAFTQASGKPASRWRTPARGEYLKGIVLVKGVKMKHYVLPPELKFGDFLLVEKGAGITHEYFVPVDGGVTFSVSKDICMNPEYFEGFDDNAFTGLLLEDCSMGPPAETDSLLPFKSIDVMPVVKRITRFNRLRMISFGRTNLDDQGLALLAPLKNIEDIRLNETDVTGPGVLAFCNNRKICQLSLDDKPAEYVPITNLLARQGIVRWLHLEKANLSEETFKCLAKCKALDHLSLRFSTFNQDNLAYLAPLQSLRSLELGNCNLDSNSFKYLKPLKHLRELHIINERFSAAEKEKLFRCLPPDCRVN